MPSSKNYKRDLKSEYKNYHSKPKQKKNRASRNAARKLVNQKGKDTHHKNGNPRDNRKSNLKSVSKKSNRSFPRTKTARKKSK